MSKKTRSFVAGCLEYKTGSEGPRHDPYSYEEYTCRKKSDTAVLHIGLATWLKVNGREPIVNFKPTDEQLVAAFEYFCGISLKTFERAINRELPCCDNPMPHEVDGLPGETLTVCEKCGKAIDYSFDINAII